MPKRIAIDEASGIAALFQNYLGMNYPAAETAGYLKDKVPST
jgi:hypothetical protein